MSRLSTEQRMTLFDVERFMERSKWLEEIPFLKFKLDWNVKVVPSYDAVIRFLIKKEDSIEVSVYLDCYSLLGAVHEPYWEIYPSHDGDTFRCAMNDTESLLNEIDKSLNNL